LQERKFLCDSILKEEKELNEIEAKIAIAQKQFDEKKKEYESILRSAEHLSNSAETKIGAINLDHALDPPTDIGSHISASSLTPLSPSSQEANQATTQVAFHSAHEAAIEVESCQSILYFLNHDLVSLLGLKQRVEEKILQMKDLISSRRRIPDEIWVQIFTAGVKGDEEPYTRTDQYRTPRLTTLRLTWICRLWRAIITEQQPLWRYIYIPLMEHLTQNHLDRIRYFKSRLKAIPPYVYTVGVTEISTYKGHLLADLFKEFPSFGRLKLNIKHDGYFTKQLLRSLDSDVQELILVGRSQPEGRHAVHIDISCLPKSIQSLRCTGLQLYESTTTTNQVKRGTPYLKSIHISTDRISQPKVIPPLRAIKSLTTFTITCLFLTIFSYEPISGNATLANLTSISCDIQTLAIVFGSNIHLPKLTNLSVETAAHYEDDRSPHLVKKWWNDFISVDQRRNGISSFRLLANYSLDQKADFSERCNHLINSLSNVNTLGLEGYAVVPALRELAKNIPPSLTRVTMADSDEVEEDVIEAFITSLYKRKVGVFSLQIDNCALISGESRQRFYRLIADLPNSN
jgi:hypothetical protein